MAVAQMPSARWIPAFVVLLGFVLGIGARLIVRDASACAVAEPREQFELTLVAVRAQGEASVEEHSQEQAHWDRSAHFRMDRFSDGVLLLGPEGEGNEILFWFE